MSFILADAIVNSPLIILQFPAVDLFWKIPSSTLLIVNLPSVIVISTVVLSGESADPAEKASLQLSIVISPPVILKNLEAWKASWTALIFIIGHPFTVSSDALIPWPRLVLNDKKPVPVIVISLPESNAAASSFSVPVGTDI